jgi:hypothetical protein
LDELTSFIRLTTQNNTKKRNLKKRFFFLEKTKKQFRKWTNLPICHPVLRNLKSNISERVVGLELIEKAKTFNKRFVKKAKTKKNQ